MASEVEFPIGSSVKVLYNGQETVGEVCCYNGSPGKGHHMIIKSPDGDQTSSAIVSMYNLDNVKSVILLEGSTKTPVPVSSLPKINISRLNKRLRETVIQKLAASRRASGGLTRLGQVLCDRLNESGFNTVWQDTDLVVLDAVRIRSPYQPENAVGEAKARKSDDFTERIRKVVSDVVSSTDVDKPPS